MNLRVRCHKHEGGSSHFDSKVKGNLSQMLPSHPNRTGIMVRTSSEYYFLPLINGNLSQLAKGNLSLIPLSTECHLSQIT